MESACDCVDDSMPQCSAANLSSGGKQHTQKTQSFEKPSSSKTQSPQEKPSASRQSGVTPYSTVWSDLLPKTPATTYRYMYVDWEPRHALLKRHAFATLDDFAGFVESHMYVGFHVAANRNRVRDDYGAIKCQAPFARDRRFPEDFYVQLTHPAIRVWIDQIMHAIDLPNRAIERSQAVCSSNTEMSVQDAKRSYDVAFAKLSGIVNNTDPDKLATDGVYDRAGFESVNKLTWARIAVNE